MRAELSGKGDADDAGEINNSKSGAGDERSNEGDVVSAGGMCTASLVGGDLRSSEGDAAGSTRSSVLCASGSDGGDVEDAELGWVGVFACIVCSYENINLICCATGVGGCVCMHCLFV